MPCLQADGGCGGGEGDDSGAGSRRNSTRSWEPPPGSVEVVTDPGRPKLITAAPGRDTGAALDGHNSPRGGDQNTPRTVAVDKGVPTVPVQGARKSPGGGDQNTPQTVDDAQDVPANVSGISNGSTSTRRPYHRPYPPTHFFCCRNL